MGVVKFELFYFMRYRATKLILLLAAILVCSTTWAQGNTQEQTHEKTTEKAQEQPVRKKKSEKQATKVSTEFGLGVGARYNLQFDVMPLSADFSPTIKMPVSYGAALQFRLNIGRSFGIQPEISYARSTVKIEDKAHNVTTKAKSNIVQIPLLLSFRIAMFRLNFGPVFTLMDEATYQLPKAEDNSIQQMHLGRLYPSVTYAAGISVKFAKIMMLDLRYADQFRGDWVNKLEMDDKNNYKRINQWVWTLDQNKQPQAQSFRTSCKSVQLRYSIVF